MGRAVWSSCEFTDDHFEEGGISAICASEGTGGYGMPMVLLTQWGMSGSFDITYMVLEGQ